MARKRQVNQPVVEESVSPINKILTTKHRLKFKNKDMLYIQCRFEL